MFRLFVFLMTLFLFAGCSTILTKNDQNGVLVKNEQIGIDTFVNLTETPMAGNRAASVVNSVLLQKGFKTHLINTALTDEYSEIPLAERLQKAKSLGLSMLLVGEVIEWRYKTGIDGEPAVSLVARVYDTQSGEVLYSSSGSKNGLGYSSLGIIAHDVIESMFP